MAGKVKVELQITNCTKFGNKNEMTVQQIVTRVTFILGFDIILKVKVNLQVATFTQRPNCITMKEILMVLCLNHI